MACKDMCERWKKNLPAGIKITPEGKSPWDFQKAIHQRTDLAYCHHDYTSEAYSLWPLFDPDKNARDPGGANFLPTRTTISWKSCSARPRRTAISTR